MAYRPKGVPHKGDAIVLLSGGLDSATALAIAHAEGWRCHTLTVSYGQRHRLEIERAESLSKALGAVEHRLLHVDISSWGGSVLTAGGRMPAASDASSGIPPTYVPARNTIFLALALSWAEAIDAGAVFLGVSAVDYSGYPDCRPEFIEAFREVARLGTKRGVEGRPVEIRAPLLGKSKAETIRWGVALGVDYSLTWSCYDPTPDGRPCGRCPSCELRRKGFEEAGIPDPLFRETQ